MRMLRVRLICTAICWAILAPLVLIADAPDWPLGAAYGMLLALIIFMMLLEERLLERERRQRAQVGPTTLLR